MTRTTITGVGGTPLPDLEAAGLRRQMRAAHTLIAEQDRLRRRADKLGHEQQRLQEQIKQMEHDRTTAWGRAIRAGEEPPTDEAIEAAKQRLEAVTREISAVRHAGDLADAELRQVVAENAAAWGALVQERGEKILAEAQEIAEALSEKLAETEGLAALHGWLTSGGQFYTPPTPATVSIEQVLYERRRDLGLVDVGVIG